MALSNLTITQTSSVSPPKESTNASKSDVAGSTTISEIDQVPVDESLSSSDPLNPDSDG